MSSPTSETWSTKPSRPSMEMSCMKSLASVIVSLLDLLAQFLENDVYGFPSMTSDMLLVLPDHQPPYIFHLNPMFLLGMLLDNQVLQFLSFHMVFVSNVDKLATMFESVPTIL